MRTRGANESLGLLRCMNQHAAQTRPPGRDHNTGGKKCVWPAQARVGAHAECVQKDSCRPSKTQRCVEPPSKGEKGASRHPPLPPPVHTVPRKQPCQKTYFTTHTQFDFCFILCYAMLMLCLLSSSFSHPQPHPRRPSPGKTPLGGQPKDVLSPFR